MLSQSPCLVLHSPAGGSHYFPLADHDTWSIGRGRDNTIVLADQWVSREHALLRRNEAGECYLIDLSSRNGSWVNDRPVQVPVLLKSGDRLIFGKTQVEFQQSLANLKETTTSDLDTKRVVITPATPRQGQIWQALLQSQAVNVQLEAPASPLHPLLEQLSRSQHPLPDLLLVDLAIPNPGPYEFCRWCRLHYPTIKVLLTSGTCREISPVERRWASYQGAVDLLPVFPTDGLLTQVIMVAAGVNQVLGSLGLASVEPTSLLPVLLTLQHSQTSDPRLTSLGVSL